MAIKLNFVNGIGKLLCVNLIETMNALKFNSLNINIFFFVEKVQILNVIRNVKIMVGVITIKYVNVQKVANYHKNQKAFVHFIDFFFLLIFSK